MKEKYIYIYLYKKKRKLFVREKENRNNLYFSFEIFPTVKSRAVNIFNGSGSFPLFNVPFKFKRRAEHSRYYSFSRVINELLLKRSFVDRDDEKVAKEWPI